MVEIALSLFQSIFNVKYRLSVGSFSHNTPTKLRPAETLLKGGGINPGD
jgi:hypothetical protein